MIIKVLLVWLALGLLSACQPVVRAGELDEPPQPVTASTTQTPVTAAPDPAPATLTPQPTQADPPTPTSPPSPTPIPEITLLFTGQIVPGRCVQAGVEARGGADYIYAAVRDLIQSADLAIGTVNGTISDFSPKTGCVTTFVLTGGAEHADAIQRAGFDAVSVATNHIKNCGSTSCGDRAFFDTLENLRRVGVVPIGAGENLAAALKPVIMDVKGVRFGIVSLGEIEPLAFATEDGPGIAVLNEANLRSAIQAARQQADVVIVMPHWGPEYSANPNWNQRGYAQLAVEAGADLVVGNHTHVVQAVQEIEGVPVLYGLGNFVFDQTWAVENTQSVMLVVRFRGRELLETELIPVVVARDGELRLANESEAEEILNRISAASRNLP